MAAVTTDRQLTIADVAELAGVAEQSIRKYRSRGAMPDPDGFLGRTPWWLESTIVRWLEERPARGQRGPGK